MTLIHESAQYRANPSAAGTHALIVGIGTYPYLIGGAQEPLNSPFGLRQLTSSPVSARAVSDWILGEGQYAGNLEAGLNNTDAPLATVDLLLSEAAPPAVGAVDVATAENLKSAIEAWTSRCDRNENNIAFLYLCGHGLKLRDLVLLASDFGEPGLWYAWERAISLDSIRLGMRKCRAISQFLFFDCCRSYPTTFNAPDEKGEQIFDAMLEHVDIRNYVAMYSTLEGSQAFGAPNEPSYFTKALLDGLCGFASENRGNGWVVTNTSLSSATHRIMRFDASATVNKQLVVAEAPGDAVLHVLAHVPKVKTRVQCLPPPPPPGLHEVIFKLERDGCPGYQQQGKCLRADIAPGEWTIAMEHVGNGWGPLQEKQLIYPPTFEQQFKYP